jgi:hypothetical protein
VVVVVPVAMSMAVFVVLVVPVPLVITPAIRVPVVVRMTPVSARVRRSFIVAGNPAIVMSLG